MAAPGATSKPTPWGICLGIPAEQKTAQGFQVPIISLISEGSLSLSLSLYLYLRLFAALMQPTIHLSAHHSVVFSCRVSCAVGLSVIFHLAAKNLHDYEPASISIHLLQSLHQSPLVCLYQHQSYQSLISLNLSIGLSP